MRKIFILIILIISCKSSQIGNDNVRFYNRTFTITLKKGYEKVRIENDHSVEYRYIYPDSSIIFLTDNITSGSSLIGKNLNRLDYIKLLDSSNITFSSNMENNILQWRLTKENNIVKGYVHTPKERKAEFDKAIASIVRK